MVPAFQRALNECKRWGVEVRIDPEVRLIESIDYFLAPQSRAGICKQTGHILWADDEADSFSAACLLHEMAHVILWREHGWTPRLVNEPLHLLGLEYEANRRAKSGWVVFMKDYLISSDTNGFGTGFMEWPSWTTSERSGFIARSVGYLNGCGIMRRGKPTYRHKFEIVDGKRKER